MFPIHLIDWYSNTMLQPGSLKRDWKLTLRVWMDQLLPQFGEYRDCDPWRHSNYSFSHLIWWRNDLSNQPRQQCASSDKRLALETSDCVYTVSAWLLTHTHAMARYLCVKVKIGFIDKGLKTLKDKYKSFMESDQIFVHHFSADSRYRYNQSLEHSFYSLNFHFLWLCFNKHILMNLLFMDICPYRHI